MNSQKICAVDGCKNIIPLYRLSDVLCHEHGALQAKRTRKKRHDPGELEAYRRALLEETLISLIGDPSRWKWETAPTEGGREGRAQARARDANRCPGWVCRAVLDAPLPPGQYCSGDCKKQTTYIRKAFRRDLERLRAELTRVCEECGSEIRITKKRYKAKLITCSQRCYQRWYHRELERMKRAAAKRKEPDGLNAQPLAS